MAGIINPMNVTTQGELLLGHSILHKWWKRPKTTNWSREQIRAEHSRLVKIMRLRGFNHKTPLKN